MLGGTGGIPGIGGGPPYPGAPIPGIGGIPGGDIPPVPKAAP